MVLSPMMQIVSKLAQQFAPQIISGVSDLVSSNSSTNTSHHFKCPKCNRIDNYGDIKGITHLICKCNHHFPCISGSTRCSCGCLLFPATSTQDIIQCDQCPKIWKIKSSKTELGLCTCKNVFNILPEEKNFETECCKRILSSLPKIPYKSQEPRILSEAEKLSK